MLLAQSELASVSIAYIDAYPNGFERKITATASLAWDELRRDGDTRAPDSFGRHWPMVGESNNNAPPQLLRIGVQFADGRVATNIGGHDRPVDGPVISPLTGGAQGGSRGSRLHQGYWISSLPPPGPVAFVCEWPALDIPVTRCEVDAQQILDAAQRAAALFEDADHVTRGGHTWPLGTAADTQWMSQTAPGRDITSAVPGIFASYCTLTIPEAEDGQLLRHERAVIDLLSEQTEQQPWWLGYLDTGASDVVFPYAAQTKLYYDYGYVLIKAGPEQAANWREDGWNWALPDLMFPADRSWLISTMRDDTWTSIGGSDALVTRFINHATLGPRARRVALGQDATPPGHTAI